MVSCYCARHSLGAEVRAAPAAHNVGTLLTRASQCYKAPRVFYAAAAVATSAIQQKGAPACSSSSSSSRNLDKEPHKFFDQVTITVRSGDGGDGAILTVPDTSSSSSSARSTKKKQQQKKKKSGSRCLRKAPDGSVQLPAGGDGGDVVIQASESVDSLIPFHAGSGKYHAKRGSNVDSMGYLTPFLLDAAPAPTLKISVPPGTVVKLKKGSKLLADLVNPGDRVLVARGGRGGVSLLDPPRNPTSKKIDAPTLVDPNDKVLVKGLPGEQLVLELTLRVVADVGIVGLPNAGKSSLLAAVSQATPGIAAYPFTTLMPNLGRVSGNPAESAATFADLPGLIKDAHLGKGLGRMFLRHLKRTRLLVHVVDASAATPIEDYRILREELRLYNPAYLERPHLIVMNKLDLLEGTGTSFQSLERLISEEGGNAAVAIVGISALTRQGIPDFLRRVRLVLQNMPEAECKTREARAMLSPPQWHL